MFDGLKDIRAIVVDLDGTLADNSHRIIHIKDPSGVVKKDWETYRHKAPEDKPFRWCVEIMQAMFVMGYTIIFLTGRNESERETAVNWLRQHVPFVFTAKDGPKLLMRPDGDFRQDAIVKSEIYDQHIEGKYDVVMAFDDRRPCVEMFRGRGVTCLQPWDND